MPVHAFPKHWASRACHSSLFTPKPFIWPTLACSADSSVLSAVTNCRWRDAHGTQGDREEATLPKHMAVCESVASRSFPTGSYRKTFVGHLAFSRWYRHLKSSSLQRSNWTASPGAHSQRWPLHTQQNWLNVHLRPCSFSKASRSITSISDTLFYWRFLAEINVSMAAVQKCKDSLEKSNINGSYLAVWQSFFHSP